jgi:predicted component of type VI protein secretion system
MEVRLVVQSGTNKGEEILLPRGEIVVGRRKGCNIRLGDARVSRQHCKIAFDGKTAVIEDLDSANGTLVNGEKVRRAALKPGDLVQLGGIMFSVAAEMAEVPDEAVAVMGRPPGAPVTSEQESITSAMAAMAEAEGEGGGAEADVLPIEVDFGSPTKAGGKSEADTAPIPLDEEVIELAQEDIEGSSAGEDVLEIQWEPPAEGESDKG